MCKGKYSGMRQGIHYKNIPNIVIQAQAYQIITTIWKRLKVNQCKLVGGVVIKLISMLWAINSVRAKCFHSALCHTPPPSKSYIYAVRSSSILTLFGTKCRLSEGILCTSILGLSAFNNCLNSKPLLNYSNRLVGDWPSH